MTRTVFDTAMVAHVWAQGRQEEGRNPARRVFFEGPCLYSYGRHFLTAYRLPDGAAFLNSDRYSVSTSRHQSDARHAIRGRGYSMPGDTLKAVAAFMESAVFNVTFWTWPDGFTAESPYGHGEGRPRSEAKPGKREAAPAELAAARPRLLKLFLEAKEEAPAESIAAAFRYAGAKPEEAAKAAAKVTAAHAKRRQEEAAADLKRAKEGAARDARAAAARPLSDFAAKVTAAREEIARHNWQGQAERQAAALLEAARRLWKAAKEAKARGWTRVAADLKAREKLLRQGAAGLEAYSLTVARVRYWKERKEEVRAGLAALSGHAPATFSGYQWQQKRQAAEGLRDTARACHEARVAALQGDESGRHAGGHWLDRPAALAGADLPRMVAGLESIIAAFQGAEDRAKAGEARAARRAQVAALRAYKRAGAGATAKQAEEAAKAASPFALVRGFQSGGQEIGGYRPRIPGAFALAGFTPESFLSILMEARARAAAAKMEEAAAKIEAWRAGLGPLPHYRQSDAKGGALIRATGIERDESGAIVGGSLETSWGATVPLAHALRAFRFLKLCRDTGRAWAANGKTLPVGHFRIESITAEGDFKAGCHRINWPEVSGLAARLGVLDLAPADTTAPA